MILRGSIEKVHKKTVYINLHWFRGMPVREHVQVSEALRQFRKKDRPVLERGVLVEMQGNRVWRVPRPTGPQMRRAQEETDRIVAYLQRIEESKK